MSNYNMNYKKSQHIFTKGAVTAKSLNSNVNVFRGGIRL